MFESQGRPARGNGGLRRATLTISEDHHQPTSLAKLSGCAEYRRHPWRLCLRWRPPIQSPSAISEAVQPPTDPIDAPRPPAEKTLPGDAEGYRAPDSVRIGDDRSLALKAITHDWRTDWSLHSVPYSEIGSGGVPRDGIPPIDQPQHVSISDADAWLEDREPVVAVVIDQTARAYPLQILTWHEIANDELVDVPVAVTFCPLCNSALAFDRRFDGRVLDFGVSGLLRNSDLIMWDRQTESLWQQLEGRGIVGAYAGAQLKVLPALLISWADFKAGYPRGDVLSRQTGHSRDYGANPYVGYDASKQQPFLFDGPTDGRLSAMERVVAVERGNDSVAYPYSRLAEAEVVNDRVGDQPLAVFWKAGSASALDAPDIAAGRDVGAGTVFDPRVGGDTLVFEALGDGRFRDRQTGSTWSSLGRALS